jgi:hypothetical protein
MPNSAMGKQNWNLLIKRVFNISSANWRELDEVENPQGG